MAAQTERLYKLTVDAQTAINELNRLNKNVEKAGKSMTDIYSLMQAGFGIGIAVSAFSELSDKMQLVTDNVNKFESINTQLVAVTGSATRASEMFGHMYQVFQQVPVSVDEIARAQINLSTSTSKTQEEIDELIKTFSVAASISSDSAGTFQAITDLVTRTVAGGLGLEDLNRLVDRGIPAFKILNDKLGLTRLELAKFGASAEGAAKVVDALMEGLNEGYGTSTAVAMENLATKHDKFVASLELAANNFITNIGLADTYKQTLEGVTQLLDGYSEKTSGMANATKNIQILTAQVASLDGQVKKMFGELNSTTEGSEEYERIKKTVIELQSKAVSQREDLNLQKDRLALLKRQEELERKISKIGDTFQSQREAKLEANRQLMANTELLEKNAEAISKNSKAQEEAAIAAQKLLEAQAKVANEQNKLQSIIDSTETKSDKFKAQIKALDDLVASLKKTGDLSDDVAEKAAKAREVLVERMIKANDAANRSSEKVADTGYDSMLEKILAINKQVDVWGDLQKEVDEWAKENNETAEERAKIQAALNSEMEKYWAIQDEIEKQEEVDRIDKLRDSYRSLHESLDPIAAATRTFHEQSDMLYEAMSRGAINGEEYKAALDKVTQSYKVATDAGEYFKQAMDDALAASFVDAAGQASDALVDFALTGKESFSDLATSIISDIAKMIVKMTLLNTLFGGDGIFSGIGQSSGFGSVYSGTGTVATPTTFAARTVAAPTATVDASSLQYNGTGGVRTSGYGSSDASSVGNVNIQVNNSSNSAQASARQVSDSQGNKSIEILVSDIVNQHISSGKFDTSMSASYGLSRRGW